jgi:hypothetical protein
MVKIISIEKAEGGGMNDWLLQSISFSASSSGWLFNGTDTFLCEKTSSQDGSHLQTFYFIK